MQADSSISTTLGQINRSAKALAGSPVNVNTAPASAGFERMAASATKASRAVRQVQPSAAVANTSLSATARVTVNARDAMESLAAQAGVALRRFVAFSVAAGSISKIVGGFKSGVASAIEYDLALNKIQQTSGDTSTAINAINAEIGRLSTSLGVSANELANVAVTLKQAGLSANDTKVALEAVALTDLSPSFSGMTQTTEALIATMRQFGTSASEMKGTLGSLGAVSAAYAVESSDLVSAIKRAGGAFASTGGDIKEFAGLFTSVRATTRESADSIATGLRTIFARLQRGDTVDALKSLGVNLRYASDEAASLGQADLTGQFVGSFEAVRRLSGALATLSPKENRYSQVIEQLGGYRQISRVIPLLQQFSVAQKAVSVGQAGEISLITQQEKRQESLANKIGVVREEYGQLFRDLTNSKGFQSSADGFLQIASSLTSVLRAVSPLIPLFSTLAAIKLFQGVTKFTAFGQGLSGRPGPGTGNYNFGTTSPQPLRKFAVGGLVPGHGNTDSVPVDLPVGSFVIRKSSTQKIGPENLQRFAFGGHAQTVPALVTPGEWVIPPDEARRIGTPNLETMNKHGRLPYASGGVVSKFARFAKKNAVDGLLGIASLGTPQSLDIEEFYEKGRISRVKEEDENERAIKRFSARSRAGFASGGVVSKENIYAILREFRAKTGIDPAKLAKKFTFGATERDALNAKVGKVRYGTYSTDTRNINLNTNAFKTLDKLRETIFHELGHALDQKLADRRGGGLSSYGGGLSASVANDRRAALVFGDTLGRTVAKGDAAKYRYSKHENFANAVSEHLTGKTQNTKLASVFRQASLETSGSRLSRAWGATRGLFRRYADAGSVKPLSREEQLLQEFQKHLADAPTNQRSDADITKLVRTTFGAKGKAAEKIPAASAASQVEVAKNLGVEFTGKATGTEAQRQLAAKIILARGAFDPSKAVAMTGRRTNAKIDAGLSREPSEQVKAFLEEYPDLANAGLRRLGNSPKYANVANDAPTYEALLKADEKYIPTEGGASFNTFARGFIATAIKDHYRSTLPDYNPADQTLANQYAPEDPAERARFLTKVNEQEVRRQAVKVKRARGKGLARAEFDHIEASANSYDGRNPFDDPSDVGLKASRDEAAARLKSIVEQTGEIPKNHNEYVSAAKRLNPDVKNINSLKADEVQRLYQEGVRRKLAETEAANEAANAKPKLNNTTVASPPPPQDASATKSSMKELLARKKAQRDAANASPPRPTPNDFPSDFSAQSAQKLASPISLPVVKSAEQARLSLGLVPPNSAANAVSSGSPGRLAIEDRKPGLGVLYNSRERELKRLASKQANVSANAMPQDNSATRAREGSADFVGPREFVGPPTPPKPKSGFGPRISVGGGANIPPKPPVLPTPSPDPNDNGGANRVPLGPFVPPTAPDIPLPTATANSSPSPNGYTSNLPPLLPPLPPSSRLSDSLSAEKKKKLRDVRRAEAQRREQQRLASEETAKAEAIPAGRELAIEQRNNLYDRLNPAEGQLQRQLLQEELVSKPTAKIDRSINNQSLPPELRARFQQVFDIAAGKRVEEKGLAVKEGDFRAARDHVDKLRSEFIGNYGEPEGKSGFGLNARIDNRQPGSFASRENLLRWEPGTAERLAATQSAVEARKQAEERRLASEAFATHRAAEAEAARVEQERTAAKIDRDYKSRENRLAFAQISKPEDITTVPGRGGIVRSRTAEAALLTKTPEARQARRAAPGDDLAAKAEFRARINASTDARQAKNILLQAKDKVSDAAHAQLVVAAEKKFQGDESTKGSLRSALTEAEANAKDSVERSRIRSVFTDAEKTKALALTTGPQFSGVGDRLKRPSMDKFDELSPEEQLAADRATRLKDIQRRRAANKVGKLEFLTQEFGNADGSVLETGSVAKAAKAKADAEFASRGGRGNFSEETQRDTVAKNTNELLEKSRRELISANQRLLRAIRADIPAHESLKIATEETEKALKGEAAVIRSTTGKLLGNKNLVNQATTQGKDAPGAGGFWFRADEARRSVTGGVGSFVSKANQRFTDKFGEVGGRKTIAAGIGASYGAAGLSSLAGDEGKAVAGGYEGSHIALKTASGAVTSATTGIAIGFAAGGPVGAAIGGVVGAFTGLVSSLHEAEQSIRQVKIDKALDLFTDKLAIISSGGRGVESYVFAEARENLNKVITETRDKNRAEATSFLGLRFNADKFGGLQQSSQRSEFAGSLPAFMSLLQEGIRERANTASNYDVKGSDIKANKSAFDVASQSLDLNGGLNLVFAEMVASVRKISLTQLTKELARDSLQAQRQYIAERKSKIGEGIDSTKANSFAILVSASQAAAESLEGLKGKARQLQEAFDGTVNGYKVTSGAEGLSEFGSANRSAIRPLRIASAANRAGGGNDLLAAGTAADDVARVLQGALNNFVNSNPLEGPDVTTGITDSVRSSLGYTLNTTPPEVAKIIQSLEGKLSSRLSRDKGAGEFTSDIQDDPAKAVRDLISGTLDPIRESAKSLIAAQEATSNNLVEGFTSVARQAQTVAATLGRLDEAALAATKFDTQVEYSREGRRSEGENAVPLASFDAVFEKRQKALGAGGLSPKDIGTALAESRRKAEAAVERQQLLFEQTGGRGKEYQEATESVVSLKLQTTNLGQALANLADTATRTGAAQEKLSKLENERTSRLSVVERFASADANGRFELNRTAALVKQAASRKTLDGLAPETQAKVVEGLRSFGTTTLSGIEGSPKANDLLEKLLSNSFGLGGSVLTGKQGDEKKNLEDEISRRYQAGADALREIAKSQQDLSVSLRDTLIEAQERFFTKLDNSLVRGEILKKESEATKVAAGNQVNIQRGIDANVLRSRGIDTPEKLEAAKARASEIQKAISLKSAIDVALSAAPETGDKLANDASKMSGERGNLLGFQTWLLKEKGQSGIKLQQGTRELLAENGFNEKETNSIALNYEKMVKASPVIQREFDEKRGKPDNQVVIDASQNALSVAIAEAVRQKSQSGEKWEEYQKASKGLGAFGIDLNKFGKGGTYNGKELGASAYNTEFVKILNAFAGNKLTFDAVDTAVKDTTASFKALKDEINALTAKLRDTNGEKHGTGVMQDALKSKASSTAPQYLLPPTYKATGGPIHGPKGTDTVPAWLSVGEHVVNKRSADANRPLLEKINAARGPVYLASGGIVGAVAGVSSKRLMSDEEIEALRAKRLAKESDERKLGEKTASAANAALAREALRNPSGYSAILLRQRQLAVQAANDEKAKFAAKEARKAIPVNPEAGRGNEAGGVSEADPDGWAKRNAAKYREAAKRRAKRVPTIKELYQSAKARDFNRQSYLAGAGGLRPGDEGQAKVAQGQGARRAEETAKAFRPLLGELLAGDTVNLGVKRKLPPTAKVNPFKPYMPKPKPLVGPPKPPSDEELRWQYQMFDTLRRRSRMDAETEGKLYKFEKNASPYSTRGGKRQPRYMPDEAIAVPYADYKRYRERGFANDFLMQNDDVTKGPVLGFNRGGHVPGFGTRDEVPALLTRGEFVLSNQAVARAGVENLKKFNAGGQAGGTGSSEQGGSRGSFAGPVIPPEALASMNSLGGALRDWSQGSKAFVQSMNGFGSAMNLWGTHADTLSAALNSCPRSIQGDFTHNHFINWSGAEILAMMAPTFSKVAADVVKEALRKAFETNPDLGLKAPD